MPAIPDILLVEDDEELSSVVSNRLRESGYAVRTAFTGPEALECVADSVPDLVLLDIMLPEMDGLEVCRRLRADHPLLYIMILTARAEEMDRVVGLEVGADDYLTKPFSLSEMIARVRSALRRLRLTEEAMGNVEDASQDVIQAGHLVIDPMKRIVTSNGDELALTVLEFDLLLYLARHPERPFTRMQLLGDVWDLHYEGYDRTVDSHVQRLRSKVEPDPGNPTLIRTVWGVGYKFVMPESVGDTA